MAKKTAAQERKEILERLDKLQDLFDVGTHTIKDLSRRVLELEKLTKSNISTSVGTTRIITPTKREVKQRKNLFNPDDYKDIEKVEGYDQIDDNVQPSPRNRPGVKYVDVQCRQCLKKESVHPTHITGRSFYVCNKCIGGR